MRFLIISDMFSLESWLIDDQKPQIMPAVYEFFNYLGCHHIHCFDAVMIHPTVNKVIDFPNGSKIQIFRLAVPFHYVRKYVSLGFLENKASQFLESGNYDLVYGMSIYANVARSLGLKFHILSVGRIFGSLIWDVIQKKQWIQLNTRFRYQFLEAKQPCDITICTEDGTEFDKAIEFFSPNAEVHMIYNGVNRKFKRQLLELPEVDFIGSESQIRVCYIARLTQWKRQDLALKFINQLKIVYKLNVQLDIYGVGELKSNLESHIFSMGLQDNITLKGSVNHDQMTKILSQYHASLFFYDASNLGNSMWESALSGRLLLTRNTGKTTKVFNRSNSLLMNDNNVNDLAIQFVEILDKKLTLAQFSRNDIDALIMDWDTRFDYEMNLIKSRLQNSVG